MENKEENLSYDNIACVNIKQVQGFYNLIYITSIKSTGNAHYNNFNGK
jgi:hypothetical protein